MQGNPRHIITPEVLQNLPTQLLLAWSSIHFLSSFGLYPQVSVPQFTLDYLVRLVSQLVPSLDFCGFLACRRCIGLVKSSNKLTGFDCGLLDYISCLVFRVKNEGRDKCPVTTPNSLLTPRRDRAPQPQLQPSSRAPTPKASTTTKKALHRPT